MTRSLNRLGAVVLLLFFAVAVSLTYWSVFASDDLLARQDNPRNVETELALRRGTLYDRNGEVLAQSADAGLSPSGKPITRRLYPQPDAISAVGYYSLVHGVGGAEEAFDSTLRGIDQSDPWQPILRRTLHLPQVGSDVRLTLDLGLEHAIVNALKPYHGAVVVIEVPSGAVRAMVSAPSFDPNSLDASFDDLLKDPAAPLLNRVTQGIYQPGGALETVILSAMLAEKVPIDALVPNAEAPLQVNGWSLACSLGGDAGTLALAYADACPLPFAEAAYERRASVQDAFSAFGLLRPPTLVGFKTLSGPPSAPLPELLDDKKLLEAQGAGQGALTVTPLQMALVAASLANHGNAISPYLADATRAPGATKWQPLTPPAQQAAVLPQEIANTIRLAMRGAVERGAAHAADRLPLTVYGHASVAITGPQDSGLSWFIGFADLPSGSSVAIAVVIEDLRDATTASNIGGLALQAASQTK